MLRDGRLHLSGIARLASHLTRENVDAVLQRACGMSHRDIRELVAELEPRPDVAPSVRKLPERGVLASVSPPQLGSPAVPCRAAGCAGPVRREAPGVPSPAAGSASALQLGAPRVESEAINLGHEAIDLGSEVVTLEARVATPIRPAVIEPLAPGRYQVRFTASAELREKLECLQALMRSSVPDGDLARIIDVAVTEKLQRVEAKRFGKAKAPRRELAETDTTPSSRHIPAAVRRRVHERDGGRCAYRDKYGRRCDKRHDLEFHHKQPFARGGDHSPANLTLMCRAHNTLLAEQDYGEDVMARFRAATSRSSVPVDAYGARIAVRPRAQPSG